MGPHDCKFINAFLFFKSIAEKAKRGGKSAIQPILSCRLSIPWYLLLHPLWAVPNLLSFQIFKKHGAFFYSAVSMRLECTVNKHLTVANRQPWLSKQQVWLVFNNPGSQLIQRSETWNNDCDVHYITYQHSQLGHLLWFWVIIAPNLQILAKVECKAKNLQWYLKS